MKRRLTLAAAAATSVGCVRTNNEDRHLIDAARGWFAVADGVGGLPFGERASDCAIRCLVHELSRDPDATILPLDRVAEACHHAVRQLGSLLSPRIGIGTTLTFLRITAEGGELAHIGDSIGYLHPGRRNSIKRLTTDHTVPVSGVLINGPVPERFIPPPRLDRYLGQSTSPACDLICFPLAPGDRLILCSDGLTRALDEADLADLSRAQPSPSALAQALVRVADIRGGQDNSTVIIIDAD
jgi:protein phosphatase